MTVKYNDVFLRAILSLVATHFIVTYAVPETFFELLIMPEYYVSMAGSYIIALILSYFVYRVTLWLDKRFSWEQRPVQRTALQFAFGFFLPGIAAFLLAFVYFRAYGLDILKTLYLRFDYPVILLLLFVLNIYYVAFYFFLRMRQEKAERVRLAEIRNQSPAVFLVNQGMYNLPVAIEQVAYFFREGEHNFLRTHAGNDNILSLSLDEIQESLPETEFFRANRQYLISRKSFSKYETLEYNKLRIYLEPQTKGEVIVSQKRSKAFKNWLTLNITD